MLAHELISLEFFSLTASAYSKQRHDESFGRSSRSSDVTRRCRALRLEPASLVLHSRVLCVKQQASPLRIAGGSASNTTRGLAGFGVPTQLLGVRGFDEVCVSPQRH